MLAKASSFIGRNCLGNQHLVILLAPGAAVCDKTLFEVAVLASPSIVVFMQPGQSVNNFHVRFFQTTQYKTGAEKFLAENKVSKIDGKSLSVREVIRCGSGSLAAAAVLCEYDKSLLGKLLIFTTRAGKISVGGIGAAFYYQTRALPIAEIDNTKKFSNLVNKKVVNSASIGGRNQYFLLELSSEKELREASVNLRIMCLTTKRALILTAKSTCSSYDYAMRYFCPQYGKAEDAATGSANAMLAAYWQKLLQKKMVRGRQLSQQRGVFKVKKIGLEQKVIGACDVVAVDTLLLKHLENIFPRL